MSGFLTHATWITQVGWLLVHSLWQSVLLAALALTLQRALQRRSAGTRYCAVLSVNPKVLSLSGGSGGSV